MNSFIFVDFPLFGYFFCLFVLCLNTLGSLFVEILCVWLHFSLICLFLKEKKREKGHRFGQVGMWGESVKSWERVNCDHNIL